MGLQVYTDNKKPKQLVKLISEKPQEIKDYIEELKNKGYEIVDFPQIEHFRRQFNVNIIVEPPAASE
jgi:O-acetylhomoserine/O-acetylserine sulfhydrylase-like pyridoxal-dependent enzyme